LENGGSITVTVPLPTPVPVYDLPESRLTVSDSGHSWHVQTQAAFVLPDGLTHVAFTSKPNMYFMDDNTDPCFINQEVSAYTFTMYEVNDPEALDTSKSAACGTH
jgi:hypothetical protein